MQKSYSFLSKEDPLWKTLSEITEDEGLVLYDVERPLAGQLRVFIEKQKAGESAKEGVTSEDCSRLCRRLMIFFSVEGESLGLSSEPEIEVSSPGINRRLRTVEQFAGALGERVKVKGESDQGGEGVSHVVVGNLLQVDDGAIAIEEEQSKRAHLFMFKNIKEARVDFKF